MNMLPSQSILRLMAIAAAFVVLCGGHTAFAQGDEARSFQELEQRNWRVEFSDPGTGHWAKNWFLDGDHAVVSNDNDGMTIDATGGYAVLWTKQEFDGDVRIEYDFQRLDLHNSRRISYEGSIDR